jgi:hypothetical protein
LSTGTLCGFGPPHAANAARIKCRRVTMPHGIAAEQALDAVRRRDSLPHSRQRDARGGARRSAVLADRCRSHDRRRLHPRGGPVRVGISAGIRDPFRRTGWLHRVAQRAAFGRLHQAHGSAWRRRGRRLLRDGGRHVRPRRRRAARRRSAGGRTRRRHSSVASIEQVQRAGRSRCRTRRGMSVRPPRGRARSPWAASSTQTSTPPS